MRRSIIVKTALASATAVAAVSFTLVGYTGQQSQPAAQERPNVVVIMTDDARVDDLAALPKTRRLIGAADGLGAAFSNSYASYPLCCPSRATLLTGQYAHNHGVLSNMASSPNGGGFTAFDDHDTLPQWLQAAGYRTTMLGKYFNEYGVMGNDPTYVPSGWDHWVGITSGVFNYHNFNVNRNGQVQRIRDDYQTTNFTRRALTVLDNNLPSDTPQFLWLSYTAPHEDFSADGRGRDYYVPAEPKHDGRAKAGTPKSDAFNEATDMPWISDEPRLTSADQRNIVQQRRERRDALRSVDDGVAAIVDKLEQHGELDNTLLLFTSDNGYMLGEHRVMKKIWPYDESVSVPLLARGPGIIPGNHADPVANVDLAATITAAAGATPGRPLDGVPLWDASADRSVLIELPQRWESGDLPAYSGVIRDRWVYIEYGNGARELYDMAADPDQRVNRAADSARSTAEQDLATVLDQLRDCVGVECRGSGG